MCLGGLFAAPNPAAQRRKVLRSLGAPESIRFGFARPETMTTTPQHGSTSSAPQDVPNLGLVRPPLVYLISLVSGTVIHLVVPLRFLPATLAVSLGVPLVAVAIALFSYSVAKFREPARPYVHESPPPRSSARARIASAGTRFIWRSRCSNSVSRPGSTACGCWPHSPGRSR
jgi:hypothetical protein